MESIHVTIDVPQPIDEVYDFLDVMANHEPFTNHILKDWQYSGPDRGVGSKARVHVSAGGRTDIVDIEVVDAERPTRIVERNIGAGDGACCGSRHWIRKADVARKRVFRRYN